MRCAAAASRASPCIACSARNIRHGLRAVHEYLDVEGRTVRPSRIVLEHDTARSAEDYWSKLQRYAALWAGEQHAKGKTRGSVARLVRGDGLPAQEPVVARRLHRRRSGLRFHWLHARYAKRKYDLLARASAA